MHRLHSQKLIAYKRFVYHLCRSVRHSVCLVFAVRLSLHVHSTSN